MAGYHVFCMYIGPVLNQWALYLKYIVTYILICIVLIYDNAYWLSLFFPHVASCSYSYIYIHQMAVITHMLSWSAD